MWEPRTLARRLIREAALTAVWFAMILLLFALFAFMGGFLGYLMGRDSCH